MYVCVPHSAHENDNKIMKHLIDQNQDLLSKSWQFGRSLKFPNGDKVVSIKISKKSLLLLQERGWMVSYCFNQLLVCIMPKSVSLKPKGNNTYEEEEQERNWNDNRNVPFIINIHYQMIMVMLYSLPTGEEKWFITIIIDKKMVEHRRTNI